MNKEELEKKCFYCGETLTNQKFVFCKLNNYYYHLCTKCDNKNELDQVRENNHEH